PVNEDLWVQLYGEFPQQPRNTQTQNAPSISVLGLLRRGVSFDEASAEFTGIAKRLAAAFPDTNKKFDNSIVNPLIKTFTPPALALTLWAMMSAGVIILAIACVNVMNMQLARAALRGKELAVRSSLGATR